MIEIYLKYDNMYTFGMINVLNCINNYVISSINSMLSQMFINRGRTITTEGALASLVGILSFLLFLSW